MTQDRKRPDWDDGSTVADMDVDGLQAPPPALPGMAPRVPWRARRARGQAAPVADSTITDREARKMALNAVWAALLLGLFFILLGALFILFCTQVWFK